MFRVDLLFRIAKIWKQSLCALVVDGINKLRYIQKMEYYSALKRNELSRQDKTWKKLKGILISGWTNLEKAILYMISTIWHFGKSKTMETVKWSAYDRHWEGEETSMGGTQRIIRAVIILVQYCNNGYISLYVCLNP